MKVKIENKFYDSEQEPIMIILSDDDKKNISNMLPECNKYLSYPEGNMTEKEASKWMEIKTDSFLVNTTQFILQSHDRGKITKIIAKETLEKIFPLITQQNMKHVLCQCFDKMLYTKEEIEDRWKFDVEEEKLKIHDGEYDA